MPFHIHATDVDGTEAFVDRVFEADYEEKMGGGSSCRDFTLLASLEGGEVVGAVEGSSWFGGAAISSFSVAGPWRKAGVGSLLMSHTLSLLHSLGVGVVTVMTFTFQAPAWYPRFGFVLRGTRAGWAAGQTAFYFSLALDAVDPALVGVPTPGAGAVDVCGPEGRSVSVRLSALPPQPTREERGAALAFFRNTFDAYSVQEVGQTAGVCRWAFEAVGADGEDGAGVRVGLIEGTSYWGGLIIYHLCVEKAWRGRGVARALLHAALALARERGLHVATVETMSFQCPGLYTKLGFEQDMVVGGWRQGAQLHQLHMRLDGPPVVVSG